MDRQSARIFSTKAQKTLLYDYQITSEKALSLASSPAEDSYTLPSHHLVKRSTQGNTNPIYKVVFDYSFDQTDGPGKYVG